MPAKTIPTSLGLCGECIDNPDVDGQCGCAVDMRVCPGCERGPLNDSEDDCGECRPCIGGDYCGRITNGYFEGGSHGPGWYCGWCECIPDPR